MDGIPVANVDTTGVTSTVAYVTADQLGTPRAVADSNGNTEWQNAYQGNPWNEQSPTSSGYVYNLGFPGQYYDVETGLDYNGARYYDSSTGRFPQADPMGLGGGINPYVYGLNNPLAHTDPTGLFPPPGEEGEDGMETVFPRQLGPNMADPMNQNVVQQEAAECPASGFRGSRGSPFINAIFQPVRNFPETIDGVNYTGHALDQMQNRGIMPSVVQNALSTGEPYETGPGTNGYYDSVNNVRVITSNQTGSVVTVIPGAPPGWK
jgi:RHS repeat-associated protein